MEGRREVGGGCLGSFCRSGGGDEGGATKSWIA